MTKSASALCITICAAISGALVFCACAGSQAAGKSGSSAAPDSYWLTLPGAASVPIIGVTGRQSSREAEIDTAREDAARKAAMYHGVYAVSENVQSIGDSVFEYYTGSEIVLQFDTELEKYMERLEFDENRDVRRTSDGGVFVRFSYPVSFPGNISYHFARNSDGSPVWTKNPPREISGFPAGVGFSGRQWRRQDTFKKSCDSAAAAIASQLSTVVTVKETASGSASSSAILQQSTGYLERFLVLETWTDPRTRGVWTLAVAGKTE